MIRIILVPIIMLVIFLVVLKKAKGGLAWDILTSSSGTPLVLKETEDGHKLTLDKTDRVGEGLYSTEDQDFMETSGSTSNFAGVPTMLATEHRAYGIPIRYAAYAKWLREERGIYTDDDLREAEREGINLDMGDEEVGKYSCPDCGEELEIGGVTYDEFNQFLDNPKLLTVDLDDFNRFESWQIRPSNVRARITKRVEESMGGPSIDVSFRTLFGIAIIILMIGIAIYMIKGGGTGMGGIMGAAP